MNSLVCSLNTCAIIGQRSLKYGRKERTNVVKLCMDTRDGLSSIRLTCGISCEEFVSPFAIELALLDHIVL